MLYILILILAGGAVCLIVSSLLQFRQRPRLRYIEESQQSKKQSIASSKLLRPLVSLLRPLTNLPYIRKLQAQADILKINMDIQALVLMKTILGVLLAAAIFMFFPVPVYALLGGMIGFFVPDFLFMSKVRAKKEAIVRVFPETIDLIDLCIGAGLDFPSSIKWVIDKSIPNPFMEQLAVVLSEIQIGRNRIDAMKDMAKRLGLRDISSFVRTVIQSERMGTSVEEGFRNLSEDTRNLRFQDGERFAIKAGLKILFPLLFCILPTILIVVAGPIVIKFMQGDLMGGF